MNRILIGALACRAYEERRQRCLDTWIPEAIERGMDVVFLIGGEPHSARREGWNLYLPCPDDYPSLPQKVRQFYQWALEHSDFDYIFKCDDDTYVRADRLLSYATEGRDYIGSEWTPGVGYGSGGAGYWLSRRAAAIVADALRAYPQGDEDVLVGKCLREAGIPFHNDQRFIAFGNADLRPTPVNDIVTTHGCDMPWKAHRTEFTGQRPVVSCSPLGRLGNNMFQVAAVLGYAAKHGTHRPIFSPGSFGHYRNTVFRRLEYAEVLTEWMTVTDPHDFSFNAQIPAWPNCSVCFKGYMQSEKYFEHCRDLIRETFAMSEETRADLMARFAEALQCNPVSLHVRRGDYLLKPEYHPPHPPEYYLNALCYISERVSVTKVLCFSDDPEWCAENLAKLDNRISVVRQHDEYLDFALMTLCSHHVIANSTFSWWGAWLGANPDKIIVAPDKHFGPAFSCYTEKDLIPTGWIRIGSVARQNGTDDASIRLASGTKQHHANDTDLCRELVKVFKEEGGSVAHFGCGLGDYTRSMYAAGIDCTGFDGNPDTEQLTEGFCKVLDLSKLTHLPRQYDWVLSLEIGGNVPSPFEAVFTQNLHHNNSRGVILSWADEEQTACGLPGEQRNAYIEERFRQLGYYHDVLTERRLRQHATNQERFRNTLMVFRRTCRSVGPSISTAEIRLLVGKDNPVVLELGANDGGDTARFLNEFPGIQLHCFEPDPRPIARFQIDDPRCTLHQVAISAADGPVDLHLSGGLPPDQRMTDWDLSSSIRPPTGHLSAHPWCIFDRTCRVEGRSLDSWFTERAEISRIDFIWADLQGAEIDLILGGRETLRNHVKYLYTEFYETPMYEGQINRQQILSLLPEFECIGLFEGYNMLLHNRLLCDA